MLLWYYKKLLLTYKHYNVFFWFRPASLWVGIHWSTSKSSICINLLPCITIQLHKGQRYENNLKSSNASRNTNYT